MNKSIERPTPSITGGLSHHQAINATVHDQASEGTLHIASDLVWLNDLIGLELLSMNKAEVKSTSISEATVELVGVRVRLL